MPTNANTFNSRITSEALEKKFRDVFPAQGGAELIQDLYAAGTIQPVIDFSSVAEGSFLSPELQTAWDFSTNNVGVVNTTTTVVSNPGFYKVGIRTNEDGTGAGSAIVRISDGLTTKAVWQLSIDSGSTGDTSLTDKFVVFLRSGDSLTVQSTSANMFINVSARQIADVNGNLVNPLGFTFS